MKKKQTNFSNYIEKRDLSAHDLMKIAHEYLVEKKTHNLTALKFNVKKELIYKFLKDLKNNKVIKTKR